MELYMQLTRELVFNESKLANLIARYPELPPLLQAIKESSATAYLVGGAVRDLLLGATVDDLDIEVHGLELEQLRDILGQYGNVLLVGTSFGVLTIEGSSIDWALPRKDAAGRKPQVVVNPFMEISEALKRRDLTINAMAIDLHTGKFIDPFLGREDLAAGILRSPDEQFFTEDPLRFYRVMQFIGRFSMMPDEELTQVCKRMTINTISRERIEKEFEKLLLKSSQPSRGIRWLRSIGRLQEILPELSLTEGTPQDPQWHPEGSVFEHLMQAVDAAAQIDKGSDDLNLILRYSALCHDLGKTTTTCLEDHRIKSPGHAEAGVKITERLLLRVTQKRTLIETVKRLVRYHMSPGQLVKQDSSQAAYKRLALKLAPLTNIDMLASLALADQQGRNGEKSEPLAMIPETIRQFLKKSSDADARYQPEKPILTGKDILDFLQPGPQMGKVLDYAFQLQIEEGISSTEELRAKVIAYFKL